MSRVLFPLLLILGCLWGSVYVFSRIAAPLVGAVPVMAARGLIAGATLLLVLLLARSVSLRRSCIKDLVLLGTVGAALPFVFVGYATVFLNASTATILSSTTPLFSLVVARVAFGTRITKGKLVALLVGVIGVALVVGGTPVQLTATSSLGIFCALASSLLYGIAANLWTKRPLAEMSPIATAAVQQAISGIALSIFCVPALASIHLAPTEALFAILALGIASAIGFPLHFFILRSAGATTALTALLLAPVFGIFLSAVFLTEEIRMTMLIGTALVLGSVVVVTDYRPSLAVRSAS